MSTVLNEYMMMMMMMMTSVTTCGCVPENLSFQKNLGSQNATFDPR